MVPYGVFSTVVSFCVQFSDPGATPGQMFTICVCACTQQAARKMNPTTPALPILVCSIFLSAFMIDWFIDDS
jgi:hypothetical protein